MRKGRVFYWGDEQQEAFEEIKRQLQSPQYCTCLVIKDDFIFIPKKVNLLWVVWFTKFRMVN